tara:strand:+ start:2448 stop:3233 length:786 start_codon:yes stop_codon:yes gene_type:complete
MDIKRLDPIGVEITGLNLKTINQDQSEQIKANFLEFSVVVIRNQELNPTDLKQISNLWGKALIHPVFKGIEGHPEIIEIRNYGEKYHTNAHWHSDVTFEEAPPDATLLYSLEVPKEGGDTLFSSQHLAYDELDSDLKSMLLDKKAVHTNAGVLMLSGGDPKKAKTVEHPVFREHPETGKKALYVTEAFVQSIKGVDSKESQEILSILYKHACKDKYIYRHKWLKGDLVVWDNRSVQHFAEHGYGDQTRTMHRLTTSGSKPF